MWLLSLGLKSGGAAAASLILAGWLLEGERVPKGCTDSCQPRGCELRVAWLKTRVSFVRLVCLYTLASDAAIGALLAHPWSFGVPGGLVIRLDCDEPSTSVPQNPST